jgi:hypothetical protein
MTLLRQPKEREAMKTAFALIALVLAVALPAASQESPSFKLTEHVFNAGGHPAGGVTMGSASFRVSLDAIGESVVGGGLSGPTFHMDASFGAAYPPPGEVFGLRFLDDDTMVWEPERSVGVYNLYRDLVSALSGLGYGSCHLHDVPGTTADDTATPPTGDGYFYLVTAENRLGQEGTKGADSGGVGRPNPSPCP